MILKYLFPRNENMNRKMTAVYETKGIFKRHMDRAPWAIETLQETFFCEREEGKIKFLIKEATKRVLEKVSCTLRMI